MDLVGDRRGQSIQIGAILLFAALIIAFASYQAFVVPNQNREVEFNHNQGVQSNMQDLRNAIVSVGGSDDSRSVTVELGTRYPSRLAARNPGPPSGSLRTVGTTDDSVGLRIANARATGETGDFWNESRRYNTGAVRYRPGYNVYTNPPDTVYDQTALYNRFPTGNITVANQSFIDGTDISLVVLNGSVSRSSTEATSVDVRSVSSSTERVRLEGDGSPMTITFASTRSAAYWDFLEETQSKSVANVTNTSSGGGFYNVSVELRRNRTYSVELTKVGVGDGVTGEDAAYLTDIEGDGATVTQGETTELTLEVRDRFNNPPDDAAELQVNGSVDGSDNGELERSSRTPDADGQVTFVYDASGSTGEQEIEFSYTDSGTGLNASTPQNVSMNVTVQSPAGGGGGGSGAYSLNWANPANTSDNPDAELMDCSAASCTWDVGASSNTMLTLRSGTTPALKKFDVEFAVNDTTVGSVSPPDNETDVDGEATTDITPSTSGTVGVYVASGGASDVFNLTIENVGAEGLTAGASDMVPSTVGQNQTVTFTADSTIDAGETVTVDLSDAQADGVDYANNGAVASYNIGTNVALDTSTSEISWEAPRDINPDTQIRISISGVETDDGANSPYDVIVTRDETGESTTTQFEVGQNTGSSDLTNVTVSDLESNTNGQTQTIEFEPTTDLPSGEVVSISLTDAQGADEVDYSNADTDSVNVGSNDLSFSTSDPSVRYKAPDSGLDAGTSVKITITDVNTGAMSNAPYTVGFSRGDAGTTSVTFSVAQGSQVEAVSDSTPTGESTDLQFEINNTGSNTVTVTDFSISTPGNQNSGVTDVNNINESPGNDEVQIGGGSANPDDPPSQSDYDTDGSTYPLNTTASIDNVGTASVTMGEFNDGNVALTYSLVGSEADADLTVTLTFGDDSTREYYFRVTSVNS